MAAAGLDDIFSSNVSSGNHKLVEAEVWLSNMATPAPPTFPGKTEQTEKLEAQRQRGTAELLESVR